MQAEQKIIIIKKYKKIINKIYDNKIKKEEPYQK